MRARGTVAVVVAAVGVAGCGGSSGNSGSGAAAWRSAVDGICLSLNNAIAAAPASETNSLSGVRKLLATEVATVAKVKSHTPPSSLKAQVDTWTRDLDQLVAREGHALNLLTAGNTNGAKAIGTADKGLN